MFSWKFSTFALLTRISLILGSPLVSRQASSNATSCEALTVPAIPGLDILSITGNTRTNYTSTTAPGLVANFCNVTVAYRHKGEDDYVLVTLWLPLTTWNNRFVATGGGGLSAGGAEAPLIAPLAAGYSTGTTDGGLSLNKTINQATGAWALRSDGSINVGLIINYAHRALHDMTVMGKSVSQVFYGTAPNYTYYTGCSNGGRMGLFAAQIWPNDYNGIVATAPATSLPGLVPGFFWPPVVMANTVVPPPCVLDAVYNATIQACDPLDGVKDGLVSWVGVCNFDVFSLVGTNATCGNTSVTITRDHATVIDRTWQGPISASGRQLSPGNPRPAPLTGLANTTIANGTAIPVPFSAAEYWIRYLVLQNGTADISKLTYQQYETIYDSSVAKYSEYMSTKAPDLTAFNKTGGKIITWHGLSDQLVTEQTTIQYREGLTREMNITETQLNNFYRVFLAPGVQHCGGGVGPIPVDTLAAVRAWVETGTAPSTLAASTNVTGVQVSRNLCVHPQVLRYNGGNVSLASSFTCGSRS